MNDSMDQNNPIKTDEFKYVQAAVAKMAWDLDWNLLRTFMVIVQQDSITGAANFLDLKQPTISNALKRLEDTLHCQLADRGPRKFILTQKGKALYRECLDIFGSIGRLPNILIEDDNQVEGHVILVMASHVVSPLLDDALATFHKNNPKATISISIQSSHDVVNIIQAKQASLGICLLRKKQPSLDLQLFYREHFGFFCGPPHPLFGRKNLQLKDLAGQPRVSFSTEQLGDVLHPVAVLRGQAQLGDSVTGLSNNLEEVRRMIMAGLGIGALPIHVVQRDVQAKRLWQLPPYDRTPEIDIHIISNPKARLNRAERVFLKILTELTAAIPLSIRTYGLRT